MKQLHYATYEVFDFNKLSSMWSNARVDHLLLSGREFRANHYHLELPDCLLDRGVYTQPCLMTVTTPKDILTIACLRITDSGNWFNGLKLHADDIQLIPPESKIVYKLNSETEWMILQINLDYFKNCFKPAGNNSEILIDKEIYNCRIKYEFAKLYQKTYLQTFLSSNQHLIKPTLETNENELQNSLFNALFNILRNVNKLNCKNGQQTDRLKVISKIFEFMNSNLDKHFKVSDYINATTLSQRSLEYLIKDLFDFSLRELFHITRLNFLHRDLINPDFKEESIAEAMKKWGIVNFGRFANKYDKLFGELPRTTIKRTRNTSE